MKPYTFIIMTKSPSQAVLIAKQEIAANGGYMSKYKFRVKGYAGSYRQISAGVEITLEDKPTVLGIGAPNSVIETKIREYFAKAVTT